MSIKYVYTIVPKLMIGDTLQTLAYLKSMEFINIDLYKIYLEASKKYDNRPKLTKRVLAPGITWMDVIFLTLHHPQLIHDERKRLGVETRTKNYFQIPIENCFPDKSFILRLFGSEANQFLPDLIPGTDYDSVDVSLIPPGYTSYLEEMIKQDKTNNILLYQNIPHYLCPKPINISNVEIITVK